VVKSRTSSFDTKRWKNINGERKQAIEESK
jgi:hypothetical protein